MLAAWSIAVAATPSLPLESVSYTVDVAGPLAEIVVVQRFRNDGDGFLDARYVFPLDADAVVDGMVMRIGERTLTAEVRGREEARRAWIAAAEEGRVAGLTEQERANVFTQHVANLPPGVPIDVELHVVEPVERVDGGWELVLPLVVAPRFVPDGEEGPTLAYAITEATADGRPDDGLRRDGTGVTADVDVALHAGVPIRGLGSPTHALQARVDGDEAVVRAEGVPLTRDLVLRWRTAGDRPEAALLVAGEHALLVVEPPVDLPFDARVPRELVFVVDASASMRGEPLALARRAMLAALGTLDPSDSFAILAFGNDVQQLRPRPATDAAVEEGSAFVDGLEAAGGTYMLAALRTALLLPPDLSRRRTVVFLTDGQIGGDPEVLAEIARTPQATFVAVGVGAAPNRWLLDEMARLGGGVSAYALLGEDPAPVIRRLLGALDRAVLTDVTADWASCRASAFAPSRFPDLRPGYAARLLARLDGSCKGPVYVTARSGAGTVAWALVPEEVPRARALASTWARERVADLARQGLRGEVADVADGVREIGLRYGIVTSETSLVAVDDRVVNPSGLSDAVDQAVDVPDGQELRAEGTSHGAIVTKEFLNKVPAGRSYQSAVQVVAGVTGGGNPNMAGGAYDENTYLLDGASITDPVTGTFSLNFNFDAETDSHAPLVGAMPDRAAPAVELVVPAPSNELGVGLTAGGRAVETSGLALGTAAGRISGPLVRDRVFVAANAAHTAVAHAGVASEATDVVGKVVVQPSADWRLSLLGLGDPGSLSWDGGTTRHGGGLANAVAERYLGSGELELRGSFAERGIAGVRRDDGQVAFEARVYERRHWLAAGVGVRRRTWSELGGLDSASAFLQDDVSLGDLTLAGGLRVDALGDAALAGPRLFAIATPGRWRASVGYARYADASRALPAGLAQTAVPRTDESHAGVQLDGRAFVVQALGIVAWERFAWAPIPDLLGLTGPLPEVDRKLLRGELALSNGGRRRLDLDLRWVVRAAEAADPALLADPASPYAPSFLEAYRRHTLSASFGWDLPTDPWTQRIAFGTAWSSAVDGPDRPWLEPVLTLSGSLGQAIDVREGQIWVRAGVEVADNDPSASLLPVEAAWLVPGADVLGSDARVQALASLEYDF